MKSPPPGNLTLVYCVQPTRGPPDALSGGYTWETVPPLRKGLDPVAKDHAGTQEITLMKNSSVIRSLAAIWLGLMACVATAQDEIGFVEKFALAEDRAKALEQLIPGTEEYYFYHALHYQNTKQAEPLAELLENWRKRVESSELRNLI